jgi:signal transduction histidine kinase/pSer/pThr/pTyr-binding forkhead associated (FHA) protein
MPGDAPPTRAGGSLVVTIVATQGQAIRTFPFDAGDKVSFGRSEADVLLDDTKCSRTHFEIANRKGACVLTDLGSSNGTFLNGQPAGTNVLESGDEIYIGTTLISVRGNLSGPTPQVTLEVRGLRQAIPMSPGGAGNAGPTMAFGIADIQKKKGNRTTTRIQQAQPGSLPGVWQVCEAVFDNATAPPNMQRLVAAVVGLGGADRAAVLAIPSGQQEPLLIAGKMRDGLTPVLPILSEIVQICSKPGTAISIPRIDNDPRYMDSLPGHLPNAGVVYAAVASRDEVHGVLYAEWRDITDFEKHFLWIWSTASQVGLLIDRNKLALQLKRANESLEDTVASRTRELETALERLSRANEMMAHAGKLASIGEVAASLVHELNTPLAVVLGYADMLNAQYGESSGIVEPIVKQANRMRRIVKNVLALARRQEPQVQPTRLRTVIDAVKELIAHELNTSHTDLTVILPDDLPPVMADSVQLEHVFINLVVNACQAIGHEKRGEVAIAARAQGPKVAVVVKDNGPGIPKELIERIFEPFFTTKPSGKGTGLGLAIAKRMLESYGAQISVANAPSGGAVFSLVFDRADETAWTSTRSLAQTDDTTKITPNVLVVDEDVDMCQMLITVLELAGCTLQGANTTADALELIHRGSYDVIVLDADDTDVGLKVLDAARQTGTDVTGRALVLATATPSTEDRRTIRAFQAELLLIPAGYGKLAETVKAIAARRSER